MHKTLRHGLALTVLLALFPSLLCAQPSTSASFKIRSWQTNPTGDPLQTGKCLDYGKSPSRNGATVFLNDCAKARSIRVVEMPDQKGRDGITRSHQVMLFAGNLVLGIHNPPVNTLGSSTPAFSTQTTFVLELQIPWNAPHANALASRPGNQTFAYDGDSIILETSRPCVNSNSASGPQICAFDTVTGEGANSVLPPPQLVIQIQNGRGANGSPIEVNVRNLSDNEFWDFVATDGSGRFPTSGFISMVAPPDAPASSATPITTNWQLWNATCGSPQVKATPASPTIYDPTQPGNNNPLLPNFKSCSHTMPDGTQIGWGTVIVIANSDPLECSNFPGVGPCIDLTGYPGISLPPGVTIRGNRRGANLGAQLYNANHDEHFFGPLCEWCSIQVDGDYARITGLRMRGESRSTDQTEPPTDGIIVNFPGPDAAPPLFPVTTSLEFIASIDHNDMSDWGDAAIGGNSPYRENRANSECFYPNTGADGAIHPVLYVCASGTVPDPVTGLLFSIGGHPATLANMRVARNFLHHNRRGELGYGVNADGLFDGNTFLENRHDITSAGEPHARYRALNNLVLSSAPHYSATQGGRLQDFDMHGTDSPGLWFGGAGGYYVEIAGNTFLGTDGHDYVLRGFPIIHTDYHGNVSLRTENNALNFISCSVTPTCTNDHGGHPFPINISNDNQFADSTPPYTNPTDHLGVGDFDGDGADDLFLTTGASWYYSPSGSREWRFLSAKTDRIDTLLLGDFDGDGRTDVVGMNPSGQFDISWGGISDWEVINKNPCANGVPNPCPRSIQNMAVGDFDGDGIPDIFYADGKKNWYISYGGTKPFKKVNDSSFPVQALRFGHFSVCGMGKETDVFGIVSGKWMVTCGALGPWVPLPVSLTNKLDGLVVADFDGDGVADVATNDHNDWMISYGGASGWKHYNVPDTDKCASPEPTLPMMPGIGHFARNRGADVLLWDSGNEFCIAVGGNAATKVGWTSGLQPYSTQDMR